MIYTITLNPSLDKFIWESDGIGSIKVKKSIEAAGGKGICVSRALANLEIYSTAIGFLGGAPGRKLESELKKSISAEKFITRKFIEIHGNTRQNIIHNKIKLHRQIVQNFKGPEISSNELDSLIQRISGINKEDKSPNVAVIGGSLPDNLNPEVINEIIHILKRNGFCVLLDASGDALWYGIKSQPYLIKPNIKEINHLWGHRLKDKSDKSLASLAKEIQSEYNIQIVLISMGARGIILVTKDQELIGIPPPRGKLPISPNVAVRNTVGAGDSAIAGFIYSWIDKKMNLGDQLKYSVAAGTATTLIGEPNLCQKNQCDELFKQIRLKNPITGRIIKEGDYSL
jgi:1-phosphofructokinase family hexose kinase